MEMDPVVGPEERYRSRNSIFHAPAHNKYGRGSDFEPKLVSIGPYYHGRENLQTMEELKPQCMSNLLKKRPTGASNICLVSDDMDKICTQFMRFEKYARVFYKEEFNLSDVDFVRMLVLDSFFIIRIILSLSKTIQESMPIIDRNIKELRTLTAPSSGHRLFFDQHRAPLLYLSSDLLYLSSGPRLFFDQHRSPLLYLSSDLLYLSFHLLSGP
ncbi:hypothetical protein FCM35_KLT00242 [Carex littledalei]|uniref:Uncharacterized protein n=1 Tax=Carex littledalei TaxID=544730 RepID=A0A833RI17_9POAL|nr:hypothetical protein FCM35_KLT00242 [Carex littledalei]